MARLYFPSNPNDLRTVDKTKWAVGILIINHQIKLMDLDYELKTQNAHRLIRRITV
jgi:hypothetical protein